MIYDIYRQLFDALKLSDGDRESLKKKRGLMDDTIDQCRFRSASIDNEEAILELLDKYTADQLQDCGLGYKTDGGFEVAKQITEPGILIPFFSWREGERDSIVYYRAHKYGPTGIAPSIYMPPAFSSKQGLIVLAESEFKAAAAVQMGIPAVGLCGVATFIKEHFDVLEEMLAKFQFKRAIILWDNDDKENPKSKKYKADEKARYDVEYYAYIMAYNVSKTVECKIAKLPDEWRIDGACDIDGSLADGHTGEEFREVLMAASTKEEFFRSWSKECRAICKPRLDKHFFRSPVEIEFGHYVRKTSKGAVIRLSNFTMEVAYNNHTSEADVTRGIHLKDENGTISRTIEVSARNFSNITLFKQQIISTGQFFFKGKQEDLDEIYQRLCTFGTAKITRTPYRIGHIGGGTYLFNNVVVQKGKLYVSEKRGDPIEVEGTGYKPRPLYIESEASNISRVELCHDDFDYREAIVKVSQNWKANDTLLGLGWIVASVFADVIHDEFGAFPILFVSGIYEGGKTTYCEFIAQFHGISTHVNNAGEITKVALSHMMRYFSNMIVWVDEYRQTEKMGMWDGYLRSIYNRQGAAKGLRDSIDQIRKVPVYGTLMISGEAMPADSALNTRIISVDLAKRHIVGQHYQWLIDNRHKFSRMYIELAKQREAKSEELVKNIKDMRRMISKQWELSDRHALNYAIIISALEMFCPEAIPGEGFLDWCMHHAKARQIVAHEDHILSQFLYDMSFLKMNGKLNTGCYEIGTEDNGSMNKFLYLHLKSAYDQWSEYKKNIGQPLAKGFNYRTISTYIKNLGWPFVTRRLEKRAAYCIAIPISDLKDEETRVNFMVGEFDPTAKEEKK